MTNFFMELSPVYQALLAGIFTWFITALGAAVVFFFKRVNNTIMNGMLGFSAGVMIAASFFSLIEPAIQMSESLNLCSFIVISIGFLLGAFLLLLGDKVYSFMERKKNINTNNQKKRCMMLITSITLHNIPEGLVMGVSFGSLLYNITGNSLISSLTLALGIGIQNFPEGSAVSLPLRREGYSRKNAFFLGQLSAIVEPISAVVGALLVMKIKYLLPYLLSMAAGAMIFVAVSDLIPESQKCKRKNLITIFTLIGFTVMMFLDVALG